MPCSWQKEDYFSMLMCNDKRSFTALEMLVDDLHADKERTVNTFLCHSGSEDFLWGLVRLLGNDTPRVAGNAAYILGTLAESEFGCTRVLSLVQHGSSEKILQDLTRMLTFDDSESVMNAAGTMGTLAESHEGREWILNEKCLPQTLDHVTALLHSENLWTASNAALVLARLSISEYGCTRMLEHEHSQHILSKLILSLGIDEAGRGMNAAFAIGRLCDMDQGRKRLLQLTDSERMISCLAKMLSCNDTGASKNACFALSCLATNSEGHSRLLSNIHSEEILRTLSNLLNAEDAETGWFAAMTLRTLASQPKGCLRLREHPHVIPSLKSVEVKEDVNADLKEEAIITLEILKRLPKPSPPNIIAISCSVIKVTWDPVVTKSGFQVRYQLFDGTKCVYTGKQCECEVVGLQPNTPYIYKLRAYTEGDESPFSDVVSLITEESVPGPPQSVRILGATITQLKIGWDPPAEINGTLKGYYIFVDDKEVQQSMDNSVILTGLTANTNYDIEVCATTAKGRGEKAGTTGTTSEIGAHAPSKPHVNVIGRNELYVSWVAPEVPLGRLNRYDVIMNDKIIYSGNDLNLPVRRLVPDTEYNFVIVALTSEGKFESKATKKRTAKDEYDQARPPLYQPPKKESNEEGTKTPTGQPSQKRRKSSATRISSAKQPVKRTGTAKERVKSSSSMNQESRPDSVASSVLSAQESAQIAQVEDKPPDLQLQQTEANPVTQSTTNPSTGSTGKPVAEVKYEPHKSIPKPKTPRTMTHPERTIPSAKPRPVALSTVSMQNNSKHSESPVANPKPVDASVTGKKVGGKTDKDLPSINSGLKIERSKTTINVRELGKGKYSSASKTGNENRLQDRADRERPGSLKYTSEKSKAIINDRDTNGVTVGRDNRTSKLTENSVNSYSREKDRHLTNDTRERSSKVRGSSDRIRNKDAQKGSKEANLPKPAPPSQKYLEGHVHSESPWGQRTIPSPRSSKDGAMMDSVWLSQVKSVSESYTHPFAHTNAISNPADSTYFIDPSQFLHRTNTYISSHRQKTIKPFVVRKDSDSRPMGRRSLEKLQKASPGLKVPMPSKSGQSVNFDFDIPDTSSKLANKFIPMQLRTQPSNLGIGQLQRVNTTLMGDLTGDNSISFRRVEALTRSHTQTDFKPQAQFQIPAENRRDVVVQQHKDKDRPTRKMSGSPGKSHKLGGSALSSSQRNKEPDSMLLQQSWGLNSSPDLGALQNVR
ncbi:uncharacterized protein LOC123564877 isoform X2 [Mercenaria mercenaria]|uniref:uncharacterized protein LOC123564877 isoform X2 n=1 Tax=Mercenaria mercenaria TaxID=6596 RepID=UPI00234EB29E|nr:uncharacterized protein LOC123564877 isoform X2 [Mercenaria mercenaria]